jgi:hypothetical protein
MKNFSTFLALLVIIVLLPGISGVSQNVSINTTGAAPAGSAMLDVSSSSKGLLIPRVTLTGTTDATTITSAATSLLVYNTATTSDVTPGYYYWDGSIWVRLTASSDPDKSYNMVTKSGNTTLLKTENMVLASGDITLTLPTVTSDDNGLEIAVKNVGGYMDYVTIVPASTKTIDNNVSVSLTRWRGMTFIANGTNWIVKEKQAITDNQLEVSETGSFSSIAEVVSFLGAHMTSDSVVVKLGAGSYPIYATQTINRTAPITFEGLSFGETKIYATSAVSGSPLFSCVTECYFKMLSFKAIANTTGNDAIRFTGGGTTAYHEVKDCNFDGFNKGVVSTNNNELWIFETDFENCTGAGIEIAAGSNSGGTLKASECDFTACAYGINLASGDDETVSVLNCTFYNSTGNTGINYVPASFTTFTSMFITNNAWNNTGTFINGFDFTRSDGRDAKAFIEGNAGMEDKRPHMKMNVVNNGTGTTITNANTYYKANWTNTSSYTCKFTIGNNRITYQPVNSRDVWMVISGNLSINQSSRTVSFGICKNGVNSVRYGESTLRLPSNSQDQPYQFSTVVYVTDVVPTDYFEFFVTSNNGGDVITVQDVNWFADSQ